MLYLKSQLDSSVECECEIREEHLKKEFCNRQFFSGTNFIQQLLKMLPETKRCNSSPNDIRMSWVVKNQNWKQMKDKAELRKS